VLRTAGRGIRHQLRGMRLKVKKKTEQLGSGNKKSFLIRGKAVRQGQEGPPRASLFGDRPSRNETNGEEKNVSKKKKTGPGDSWTHKTLGVKRTKEKSKIQ